MTQLLRPAVYGKVLGRGHHFQIFGIVPLQPGDKGQAHARSEIGILTVGLLPSAPARIAKDVDVRRPYGQAKVDAVVAVGDGIGVFGSRFGGDGVSHGMHQAGIPGCGQANGLGKDGGIAGACHAMQPLVPPGVFGDAQPRNGRRGHGHLGDFLFRRQAPDQVGDALLDGQRRVLKGKIRCVGGASEKPQKQDGHSPRLC